MDRQNEGIEDAAELRLILLDMGGLLPQSEGKQDWPSYGDKTFPLVYLSDPRIVQIRADLTLQDIHKLCLLSRNQIEPVSRILAISGVLGHFQQKYLGRFEMPNDTSFAVMYKKLVDRNFEPEPQMLKKIRSNLMGQISAQASPVTKEKQIWTKRSDCDKIPSGTRIGEEKK